MSIIGYKADQYARVQRLIKDSDVFYGDLGYGYFRQKQYPFVLTARTKNLYEPIRYKAIEYFDDNNISWWGGYRPTNHTLSSQIACINHLFPIRHDKDAVLAIAKNINPNITDVLTLTSDKVNPGFIQLEAVSKADHLNEMDGLQPTRGSHCTSIDALILGELPDKTNMLIVIEWKYTESYGNDNKALGNKGLTRKGRYTNLINESTQLSAQNHDVYYYEPFYQLMRQTLWAEQMIANKGSETIKADTFMHVHIIPPQNIDLLDKTYRCSSKGMKETWRDCLTDKERYTIISPSDFLAPIDHTKYKDLIGYLNIRYWDDAYNRE